MKQILYNSPIKIGDTIRVGRPVIDPPVLVDYYTGRDEYVVQYLINCGDSVIDADIQKIYGGEYKCDAYIKQPIKDWEQIGQDETGFKVYGLTKVNKDNTIASPNT